MLNAHIDTVPANSGWSGNPWVPRNNGGKIVGLGACDIKGAVAAAIAAVDTLPADRRTGFGLLFSGDEERGTASVSKFLRSPDVADVQRVIVCEPTNRTAGVAHRGVHSYRASLAGEGGHSSKADHLTKPVAALSRLAVALDDFALANLHSGPPDMPGLCMNVAAITGGVAFNVVPTSAELLFSMRPPPGFDQLGWHATLQEFAHRIDPRIVVHHEVDHDPFASVDEEAMQTWVGPYVDKVSKLDFWTEAALWSQFGRNAVVIGPGNIAQAHSADEWVLHSELNWAIATYRELLSND